MYIKCEEEHFVQKVAESPRRETLRGRNQYIPIQYVTPFTPNRTQQNWNSWVK
jgi:hypothetical protein